MMKSLKKCMLVIHALPKLNIKMIQQMTSIQVMLFPTKHAQTVHALEISDFVTAGTTMFLSVSEANATTSNIIKYILLIILHFMVHLINILTIHGNKIPYNTYNTYNTYSGSYFLVKKIKQLHKSHSHIHAITHSCI